MNKLIEMLDLDNYSNNLQENYYALEGFLKKHNSEIEAEAFWKNKNRIDFTLKYENKSI